MIRYHLNVTNENVHELIRRCNCEFRDICLWDVVSDLYCELWNAKYCVCTVGIELSYIMIIIKNNSSVESQKGVTADQRTSVEN